MGKWRQLVLSCGNLRRHGFTSFAVENRRDDGVRLDQTFPRLKLYGFNDLLDLLYFSPGEV